MSEPFYRGRSKATMKLLEASRKITEAVQPITVRGVCYRLFVAKLIDSMAVKNTQKISRLVWAREKNVIPWKWIVDESRQMERAPHWRDLAGYAESVEKPFRRDFWAHQHCHVIVISEKATVSGILRPVLDEYGVAFFPVHGFNSATKVHELAEQIAGDKRKTVLLYVGDFDPSVMFMSERDLPTRLENYGAGGFLLRRIALIKDDIDGLPSFEAKRTDPRFSWYVDKYGDHSWELEAMDPNDFRDRVRDEIQHYIDAESWERHKLAEKAEQETVCKIAECMMAAAC